MEERTEFEYTFNTLGFSSLVLILWAALCLGGFLSFPDFFWVCFALFLLAQKILQEKNEELLKLAKPKMSPKGDFEDKGKEEITIEPKKENKISFETESDKFSPLLFSNIY